jgi:hypothetical protein
MTWPLPGSHEDECGSDRQGGARLILPASGGLPRKAVSRAKDAHIPPISLVLTQFGCRNSVESNGAGGDVPAGGETLRSTGLPTSGVSQRR